jgi:hypothetical protein
MTDQMNFWPSQAPLERLRWSISRARRLEYCPRKYYLQHYASIGGKRAPPASLAHQAYIYKQLSNRFMWVGNIVHSLVEQALTTWRGGGEVAVEALIERGDKRMRAEFAISAQKQCLSRPAEAFGLMEHVFDEPVAAEEWRAMRARMERCLRHFVALPIVARIQQLLPLDWLALETMSSFEMQGAAIVVVPDVAWREADGQIVLVDWKTGQLSQADAVQLAVYGLFADRVWGQRAGGITAHDVYLDAAQTTSFGIADAELERAVAYIDQSVAQMRTLVARPSGAPLEASRFAMTQDLSRCAKCCFRRVCKRDANS